MASLFRIIRERVDSNYFQFCPVSDCLFRQHLSAKELTRRTVNFLAGWAVVLLCSVSMAVSLTMIVHAQGFIRHNQVQADSSDSSVQVVNQHLNDIEQEMTYRFEALRQSDDARDKRLLDIDTRLVHVENQQIEELTVFGTVNFLFVAVVTVFGLTRKRGGV